MSNVESKRIPDGRMCRPANTRRRQSPKPVDVAASQDQSPSPPTAAVSAVGIQFRLLFGFLAIVAGIWAYWTTLVEITGVWIRDPDYAHGLLVIPIAVLFLWLRRASFPGFGKPAIAVGLSLLVTSLAVRYFGARFYLNFVDGYSILLWLAAAVSLLGGWPVMLWTLPSIGFLFFAIQLPFGIETALSFPLQRMATELTCWMLQLLGQPAFAAGNEILLGDHRLEVAQACSGLKLFMSITAMAYVYVIVVRRTWWEKAILFASLVPIAIVSNAVRITSAGLLIQYGLMSHQTADKFAGVAIMLPLAFVLFALVLWYLGKLIRVEEIMDMSSIVREVQV
jgi:exosortase